MTSGIDSKQLRNCFGKFATGVTVITTLSPEGNPVGLTVNSFSSLSLDPPMILWSLDKKSRNRDVLDQASHFVVNVLASDQMTLSNQFAGSAEDKFAGVECVRGKSGIPVLSNTVAYLECKNVTSHEGGDHIIYIGEVEFFEANNKAPLLFTGGQYGVSSRHPEVTLPLPSPANSGERHSSDDFIIPLLLRSYWEVSDPFYTELNDCGFPITHARLLVHLSLGEPLTVSDLAKKIRLDFAAVSMSVSLLLKEGHIMHLEDDRLAITEEGQTHLAEVHDRAHRFETEVLAGYSPEKIEKFKSMLRDLIYRGNQ